MNTRIVKANCFLLLTAAIWGFAFVAQRTGMEHMGPFTFNGIRFALGCIALTPVLYFNRKRAARSASRKDGGTGWASGALLGLVLFLGASLQQFGLVYTTAGNAGFITGLYMVIVPLMGLIWRQYPDTGTWAGVVLAAAGLYFLSVTEHLTIAMGDALVLAGAFFWAGHVLMVDRFSPKMDPFTLAFMQFAVCSVLSTLTALFTETITWEGVRAAAAALFYGGFCSVGIAYTIQVVAQKNAKPAHAAIILSMESPFAALGGCLLLGEVLTPRGLMGCCLMLGGMIISQIQPYLSQVIPGVRERILPRRSGENLGKTSGGV